MKILVFAAAILFATATYATAQEGDPCANASEHLDEMEAHDPETPERREVERRYLEELMLCNEERTGDVLEEVFEFLRRIERIEGQTAFGKGGV